MNYRYIWEEIRRRRHRTLVNILGIAIGIALFISINAVSAAYQDAASLPFKNIGADIVVQQAEKRATGSALPPASMRGVRLPFSNQLLPPADIAKLRALPEIDSASASLLLWEFRPDGFQTVMGYDPSQPGLGPVKVKNWLAKGRFPDQPGEAVLEKHFAKFHHIEPGGVIAIGGRTFNVTGLLEIKEGAQVAAANIYLPLTDAQKLLAGNAGGVNVIYLHLKNPGDMDKVKARIAQMMPGATVTSSDSFLELMGGISKISGQFSLIVSLVALAGAFFLIIKTMLGNLIERTREIGILKTIGWTGGDIRKQVLGEVFLQSLIGGAAGIAAGYLISFLLGNLSVPVNTPWEMNLLPAFARATEAAPKTIRLPVHFSIALSAAALALALIGGALSGYFMCRRTDKMKPADILRRL